MSLSDIIKVEEGEEIVIEGTTYKTGTNDVIVYKSPITDFNIGSQLIVHESQEAVFYLDGRMLDSFGSGRYTLDTDNIPLLVDYYKNIVNKSILKKKEKQTPFHCEIYFVNKVHLLNLKWGTPGKVNVVDPILNYPYNVGANGEFGIRIKEPRKFLGKIIGTMPLFTKENVEDYFKSLIGVKTKVLLANILNKEPYNQANQRLEEMSSQLKTGINEELDEYGISVVNFYVASMAPDDNFVRIQNKLLQSVEKNIDMETEARKIEILAKAEKIKMETIGYDWQQEKQAEISKAYAEKENSSDLVGTISQIPAAMAMGEMLVDKTKPLMTNNLVCRNCGKTINSEFKCCPYCAEVIITNCKKCNRELETEFKCCPYCGEVR